MEAVCGVVAGALARKKGKRDEFTAQCRQATHKLLHKETWKPWLES